MILSERFDNPTSIPVATAVGTTFFLTSSQVQVVMWYPLYSPIITSCRVKRRSKCSREESPSQRCKAKLHNHMQHSNKYRPRKPIAIFREHPFIIDGKNNSEYKPIWPNSARWSCINKYCHAPCCYEEHVNNGISPPFPLQLCLWQYRLCDIIECVNFVRSFIVISISVFCLFIDDSAVARVCGHLDEYKAPLCAEHPVLNSTQLSVQHQWSMSYTLYWRSSEATYISWFTRAVIERNQERISSILAATSLPFLAIKHHDFFLAEPSAHNIEADFSPKHSPLGAWTSKFKYSHFVGQWNTLSLVLQGYHIFPKGQSHLHV